MSSPKINNLMLSGGISVYLSLIFMGLDLSLVSEEKFLVMWKGFYWTFTIGFSIFFGSMLSKTWRVHRIFTSKSLMPKKIKDPLLFTQVTALASLDVCVLVVWEIVDPLYIVRESKTAQEDPAHDSIVVYIYARCISRWKIYWTVALYAKHGLLLMFGAFLAWETRKVYMPVLNDSKQIGTSLYVVMASSAVGFPVSILMQSPNDSYCILALLIFATTTFTMCIVFVPKVRMRNEVYPQGTVFTERNINQEYTVHEVKADNCSSQTQNSVKSNNRIIIQKCEQNKDKEHEGLSDANEEDTKSPSIHKNLQKPKQNPPRESTAEKAVNTSLSFTPAHSLDKHLRQRKLVTSQPH
ncbi:gamma-aminobutyric acid type B receptor subunit 2-like [Amphiura filiformis]|uniref:gamma-aminobutyric acid type B receptor subunit 2-like n=1 Tax=Amphiura filiformis TaxID=82378 RepID=UPI003B217268